MKIKDNRAEGSIEKSKEIEITDVRKLLSEKVSYSLPEVIGSYGIDYQLKKFAGINSETLLNKCTIEHGLAIRRAVCQCEVTHHVSCILTFSPFREEVIKELTDIPPIAIGPYIAYAEHYRSREYIEKMKKKAGRVLLVMPSHSIPGIVADYDINEFIQQIEDLKSEFDTVMVCIYYEDMRRGLWKLYKKNGYCIVSAGNTRSPYFLNRLKDILYLSDAVILNGITTGMAYAMHMQRPIKLIQQKINQNVTCHNNAYELELGLEILSEKIYKLFDNQRFIITKEQREFGNYMFGLENIKSKAEMRKLLISLSR